MDGGVIAFSSHGGKQRACMGLVVESSVKSQLTYNDPVEFSGPDIYMSGIFLMYLLYRTSKAEFFLQALA